MADNLTQKQNDYAIFLPAISGFYATFIGKQRAENYVEPSRMPAGLTDMEMMNWLNSSKALFPYKWSLYSGGHADLDLTRPNTSEDMLRQREPGSVLVGDSGGFQIAKGLWDGEWRDPNSAPVQHNLATLQGDELKAYQKRIAAAQAKREGILKWLDTISDYGMGLDIPTWIVNRPSAMKATNISNHDEAVGATKFNMEYFINNRKGIENGGARFLNVLQGANHTEAEDWYQIMKQYCDPKKYPGRHFDGWGMGGQNMCDVHLILKRLIALKYDGLLEKGKHDWMHFLGTSRLEWAVLLTTIQRNVRKYANSNFTISFDCASPFLATANGQVYYENVFPNNDKWSYRMSASADDKKYATDTRKYSVGTVADEIFESFTESPISNLMTMKDICIYKPGDLNKNGKEGKTSWDSFSYALLMGHNVWMHIDAVQQANRLFDAGESRPGMMQWSQGDHAKFEDVVESIFAAPTREASEAIIENYNKYWMEIIGGRGYIGKRALNSTTIANNKDMFDLQVNFDKPKPVKKAEIDTVANNTDVFDIQINLDKPKPAKKLPPTINTTLFEG